MNNPEKLETFGTKDTGRILSKTQHNTKKDEQRGPHQYPGVNPDAFEIIGHRSPIIIFLLHYKQTTFQFQIKLR
jgi:hypothetical protein